MNSDKILKYHELIADGKDGDAFLLMAIEFESGGWMSEEPRKDDYNSRKAFEHKRKEGLEIAQRYYSQACDACVGLNKLRALVGLFRCRYGSSLYDYPKIQPEKRLVREQSLCDKLIKNWSLDFRSRIQHVKERSCGAVQCLEALAAELGLEGTIPSLEIESMYELAVLRGSAAACFRIGNLKRRQGDEIAAERFLRLGVSRGSVEAERALGESLLRRKSTNEGLDCLIRAAKSGSGEAWFDLANYLATVENEKSVNDDVASCYRFAVRCGCFCAYDWLSENEPIDQKDRYGFRSNRQRIKEEYIKRQNEAMAICNNAELCYAAYRYLIELRNYNHPDLLRIAVEKAATLGCCEAMFELARLLDSSGLISDKDCCRAWRDVEDRREKNDLAAVAFYRRAAAKGHAEAMRIMGYLYRDGRIVVSDKQSAHRWIEKAAIAGDVEAQLILAGMCRNGEGCEENAEEAFAWYLKAFDNERLNECSEKLAADGCWRLGQMMECPARNSKWDSILSVYKRAAENFHSADAYWRLGELYESGMCGKLSNDLAAQCYCKALFVRGERQYHINQPQSLFDKLTQKNNRHKDSNAISEKSAYCAVLAYGYDVGFARYDENDPLLLTPNAENARKWYGVAMQSGCVTAAWRYGELCEQGVGGAVDLNLAESSYCMAAASGRLALAKKLADKYKIGNIGGDRHFEQAAIWYRKCIDLGDRESAFLLGSLYMSGEGVPRSVTKAMEFFEKSNCDAGYIAIANICLNDTVSSLSLDRALRCLDLCVSCEARILRGKLCIKQGKRYECGDGVEKNLVEASRWYSKAARAKCIEAQVRLSELYERGSNNLRRDLYWASFWCYWAAENGDARSSFRLGLYCELGIVENDQGMAYVMQLYNKAELGGCEEARARLEEMRDPMERESLPLSCNLKIPEVLEINDIHDIVNAEKEIARNVTKNALVRTDNNTWSDKLKQSKILRRYVIEHDIGEVDIQCEKFNIVFNETRKKIEPYYEDYDDYDGRDDYDDYTPRTYEDAYEIYGSRLWDA